MRDISWNLFRETGNIETYLLMKELDYSKETVRSDPPQNKE